MNPRFEKRFNDVSTSDFLIKCKDSVFFVHQSVLIDKCEYFAALMRNECIENKKKELIITDFEPHIVEIFLKFIYTDTMNLLTYRQLPVFHSFLEDMSNLMQIADKYLLTKLLDICDSYLAQWFTLWTAGDIFKNSLSYIVEEGVALSQKVQAKKLALSIFHWILKEKSGTYEKFWTSLMERYPDFLPLVIKIYYKKKYSCWIQQHTKWCFNTNNKN